MSDTPPAAIVNHKLIHAALEGRIEYLRALVAQGGDINCAYEGRSLLCHIIAVATPMPFDGVADVMRAMVDAGADVNRAGPDGMTPLLTALQTDRRDMLDVLLECGAAVNLIPQGKVSPLYLALEGDLAHSEDWRTRLLVARGADPDQYVAAISDSGVQTMRQFLAQTAAQTYNLPETSIASMDHFTAHARHLLSCLPAVTTMRQRKLAQQANANGGRYNVYKGPKS